MLFKNALKNIIYWEKTEMLFKNVMLEKLRKIHRKC